MTGPIRIFATDLTDEAVRIRHEEIERRLEELGLAKVRIMFEQGARCDILHHSFTPPKRPKSCEFGFGNSVFIGDSGKGVYGCVSDSALDAGTVLSYGESLRKGRFTCTSEEIGVRCVNGRNGHGFLLSRQQVKFF